MAIVRLEGLGQSKKSDHLIGNEPSTFQLVAQLGDRSKLYGSCGVCSVLAEAMTGSHDACMLHFLFKDFMSHNYHRAGYLEHGSKK
jgi:hypothetical protein